MYLYLRFVQFPILLSLPLFFFFFFNDTATTEIYTLPLHDALPILSPLTLPMALGCLAHAWFVPWLQARRGARAVAPDRKSTRLNSSHLVISYAVFCLKKKKRKEHVHEARSDGRASLYRRASMKC